MADKIKIKIILGSVREGRFGERPAKWIYDELKKNDGVDVELLDLKDYPMPFFNVPTSPAYMNMKYPDEVVQKFSAKINDGDAFVIVSPEYNHGFSAVLKNALDWLSPEWAKKPVGFVSYGSAAGARAIEQLRLVAIELKMVPIQKSIHLSWDYLAKFFADRNISDADLFGPYKNMPHNPYDAFVDDLLWNARMMKAARNSK